MKPAELNEEKLNTLIDEAMANYENESKENIYKDMGVSLIASGFEPDSNRTSKYVLKPQEDFNFEKGFIGPKERYVDAVSREFSFEDAKVLGKNFWKIFKEKAKSNICGDKGILKLLEEDKVKDALKLIVPTVLAMMGIGIGAATTILAGGIVMLLLKAGIQSLCELNQ